MVAMNVVHETVVQEVLMAVVRDASVTQSGP